MKKLLLFFSIVSVSIVNAQHYYGTEFIGESGNNISLRTTKNSNKIIMSGYIGGGLTGAFPISFSGGNADGILTSLSPTDGTIQWIKQFGGGADEVVVDSAIDGAGNIYITGYYTGGGTLSMDADPGPAVYPLAVTSTLANRDIFLIKLDASGNFVWAKQINTPSGAANDDVSSIELDASGNIYLAGSYVYVDFDPGTGTQILTSTGNADGFIAKYDNNGGFLWVKTLNSNASKITKIMDLKLDEANNIYAVGRFNGTVDLDTNLTNTDIKTTAGNYDTFLSKYDSSGNYLWGKNYGGTGSDSPEKLVINGSNIFIGGAFSSTVDLDPSAGTNNFTAGPLQSGYLSKFATDGSYVSSFVIPETGSTLDSVKDILVDATGNIYLAGLFQTSTISGTTYTAASTNLNTYYLKLTPSLNFSSIYLIKGTGLQTSPMIEQIDSPKFIGAGASKSNADFDYTAATSVETPANAQYFTFVTKFDFEQTLATNEVNTKGNLVVYPIPAVNELNIKSDKKITSAVIYSADGKMVMNIKDSNNISNINVSLLTKGVYFIQTIDVNGQKNQTKFIKK